MRAYRVDFDRRAKLTRVFRVQAKLSSTGPIHAILSLIRFRSCVAVFSRLPFASDRLTPPRFLLRPALSSRVHSSAVGVRFPPAPPQSDPVAMSQSNNRSTAQSDGGSAASRTRRQTRIRSRDEEGEEEQHAAQPSSHVSPAMRIYRHALESVFAMLPLDDLSRVLAVSREWAAAVRSMKPNNVAIARDDHEWIHPRNPFRPLPLIASIVGSPLLRHVSAIQIRDAGLSWTLLDNASLGLLAQYVPNLTSLCCKLTLAPNQPLTLPAKLLSH